jgi:hypothetical protein
MIKNSFILLRVQKTFPVLNLRDWKIDNSIQINSNLNASLVIATCGKVKFITACLGTIVKFLSKTPF